jgi:hypothetical protein
VDESHVEESDEERQEMEHVFKPFLTANGQHSQN